MLNILKPDRKREIRGVLFDLDGVVIDTEKLYTRFWMEASRELGHPMTFAQALQMRSLGSRESQEKLDSFFGAAVLPYADLRARRIELMEAFIAEHGVEEKRGIRELLAHLKEKNIPRAITSSSSIPVIRRHLGNLGLLDGFTALCSGKDVPMGKPAPDIYLHGAAQLGVKPEECIALEDSKNGLLSAHRAGCKPVMVPDLWQPDEEILQVICGTYSDLEQVKEALERGEIK